MTATDALFLIGPIGGAAGALVAAAFRAGWSPSRLVVPDPFARDFRLLDVVNIAHVRVAGVGGLGLVMAAAVVVVQYRLLTAAYLAGFVGGLLGALLLIVLRRRRPSAGVLHVV
ncbi:MAG: hypothetical protein IT184_09060 [Acidobacteria bacterium]|nr:hypothetical protein [Acidobacteriota bacterium]